MRSELYDVFIILQGFKKYLLNKEELLQITDISDREELFRRLKKMFFMTQDVKGKTGLSEYFGSILSEYINKINVFLKTSGLGLDMRDITDFKTRGNDIKDLLNSFGKLQRAVRLLEGIKWAGRELFYEWWDLLLTIFLFRIRNSYGIREVLPDSLGTGTLKADYSLIRRVIFEGEDIKRLSGEFPRFAEAFGSNDPSGIFERARRIFYTYLIQKSIVFDFDDIPSIIFSRLFLFIRQSEIVLASVNCLELGIERKKLYDFII